jgi:hypothetical protein
MLNAYNVFCLAPSCRGPRRSTRRSIFSRVRGHYHHHRVRQTNACRSSETVRGEQPGEEMDFAYHVTELYLIKKRKLGSCRESSLAISLRQESKTDIALSEMWQTSCGTVRLDDGTLERCDKILKVMPLSTKLASASSPSILSSIHRISDR